MLQHQDTVFTHNMCRPELGQCPR